MAGPTRLELATSGLTEQSSIHGNGETGGPHHAGLRKSSTCYQGRFHVHRRGAKPTTTLNEPTIAGLRIRIGLRSRTWILQYRVSGRQRKMTLGYWPTMRVDAARRAALEALRDRPVPDQIKTRLLPRKYLRRRARSQVASQKDDQRSPRDFVAHAIATRAVAGIRRRDVAN
jgi:hypothetical protein